MKHLRLQKSKQVLTKKVIPFLVLISIMILISMLDLLAHGEGRAGIPISTGTVVDFDFPTPSLEVDSQQVKIYFPADYDEDHDRKHRIIIYLHGALGNDHNFISSVVVPAADELIANGEMESAIIVMPNLQKSSDPAEYFGNRHMYANSEFYGNYEDVITVDLINFLRDQSFRKLKDKINLSRETMAIMGLSMGGDGAIRIVLRNPTQFGVLASHAGAPSFADPLVEGFAAGVVAEAGDGPPYIYDITQPLTSTLMGVSAAWLDLDTMGQIQFLLDSQGNIRQDILDQWRNVAEPATMIADGDLFGHSSTSVFMYIEVNAQDHFGFTPFNQVFTQLQLPSIPVDPKWFEYVETPGPGHLLTLDRAKEGLKWVSNVMDQSTPTKDVAEEYGFSVYPNPVVDGGLMVRI